MLCRVFVIQDAFQVELALTVSDDTKSFALNNTIISHRARVELSLKFNFFRAFESTIHVILHEVVSQRLDSTCDALTSVERNSQIKG